MKIQKQQIGVIKPKSIPPIKNIKCPSCHNIGEYETDDNKETYCKICGLVISSPYPYTAGLKFWTLCDFKYQAKLCELNKKWEKKRKLKRNLAQPK